MKVIKYSFSHFIDGLGFSASTLCAIHCALLPVAITMLPMAIPSFLATDVFEWVMMGSSTGVALVSFLIGYYKHHRSDEPLSLMLIVFIFFTLGHPRELDTWRDQVFLPIGGV